VVFGLCFLFLWFAINQSVEAEKTNLLGPENHGISNMMARLSREQRSRINYRQPQQLETTGASNRPDLMKTKTLFGRATGARAGPYWFCW